MKIHFNDLYSQWQIIKEDCNKDIENFFRNSQFILGPQVKELELAFASYIGTKYAVGVSNGTDALKLAAQSLDLNDKNTLVIIPANTYIATIFGIENALPQATFKLIDCDEYYQMDTSILEYTLINDRKNYDHCVIVPVHLYGYTCDMKIIEDLSVKYNCVILEDASQAHGAMYKDIKAGAIGKVSAFSLYPGKNLGAAGDAGIVVTSDDHIYERLLALRNLGSVKKYDHIVKGYNHRLDSIQAIIVANKLDHLDEWNENRRQIVKKLERSIRNEHIKLPSTPSYCIPIHHIYPVITKDKNHFQKYLTAHNIEHGMHYPVAIEQTSMYQHLQIKTEPNQNTLNYCDSATSLPMHPFLTDEETDYMINIINGYDPSITL